MMYKVKKRFSYGEKTWNVGSTIKDDEYPDFVIESLLSRGAIEEIEKLEIEEPEEEFEEPKILTEKDEWKQLGRDLDQASELPRKWNPSRDDPDIQDKVGQTIFGTVIRIGSGPYGRFLVARGKDTEEEYTVWEQTALSDLMDQASVDDKIAIRFEGLAENPRGQKYLNYSSAVRSQEA